MLTTERDEGGNSENPEVRTDDGSMKGITEQGTSLILTPQQPAPGRLSQSYYYENLPCTQAASEGYKALSFTVKAPSRGSNFTLEIQTASACGAAGYTSDWQVVKDLTGDVQTVTVPLAGWAHPKTNPDAVTAFNWATWTSPTQGHGDEQWQLGDIMFVCADADEPAPSTATGTASSSSSVVVSSVFSSSSSSFSFSSFSFSSFSFSSFSSSSFSSSTTTSGSSTLTLVPTSTKLPSPLPTTFRTSIATATSFAQSSTTGKSTTSSSRASTTAPPTPLKHAPLTPTTPSRPTFCFLPRWCSWW